MPPGTSPRVELKKAAVVPQVIDSLAKNVAEKKYRDSDHPSLSPNLVTAHCAVNVKRYAAVFGLLAGMPQPQGLQPLGSLG
jgi:hypothetical protein